MIVRILGEGQWVLEPDVLLGLNELDARVEQAVSDGKQEELTAALAELLAAVREQGNEVPVDMLVESDLVLPNPDATVEEVSGLLEGTSEYYGLIPDSQDAIDQVKADRATGESE